MNEPEPELEQFEPALRLRAERSSGDSKKMRLFVAIDIEPVIASAIFRTMRTLRARAPDARWSRMESLHLTLKFLGEVPEERERPVTDALAGVSAKAIRLRIAGLGMFPNVRSPRVLWAGVEPTQTLANLALAVEDAAERLGFARETRPYFPHLTLARSRAPGDLQPLTSEINALEPDFGEEVADAFYLYQSHPGRGGYDYEKRRRFELERPIIPRGG
jgi:2'-5' RNA ligase